MNILEQYGYKGETCDNIARVTAVHRERYELITNFGATSGRLKSAVYYHGGNEEYPTAGDFVKIQYNPSGESLITETLPRKTVFLRKDPDPQRDEQAVAANFDCVFIMMSLNANFNIRRIERYLTMARQSGAEAVIILTKADLTADSAEKAEQVRELTKACVYVTSSLDGTGIEILKPLLTAGKTFVFLGSSGVGKSTLINSLAGEELMKTGEINEKADKGHHTTTHRELLMLESGVMIIDTPGMRALGMWAADEGLSETFSDIDELIHLCRFSDCTHTKEPGCAVRAAISAGELDEKRWNNYHELRQEISYADNRVEFLKRRREFNKGISKKSKEMEKSGKLRH